MNNGGLKGYQLPTAPRKEKEKMNVEGIKRNVGMPCIIREKVNVVVRVRKSFELLPGKNGTIYQTLGKRKKEIKKMMKAKGRMLGFHMSQGKK